MEKIMKRSALVAVLLLLQALLSACAPADSRPVLPGGSEGQEEPGNGGGDPDVPQSWRRSTGATIRRCRPSWSGSTIMIF